MRITDLVSFIDDLLFRPEDRRSLMLEFIVLIIYIMLLILCTIALSEAHGSLVRALVQSLTLLTLFLPGAGFLMCIFREPGRNSIVDNYAEGRYMVFPLTMVLAITIITFDGFNNHFDYSSEIYFIRIIQILIWVITTLIFVVLCLKIEFSKWGNHADKIKFINSRVAIFGVLAAFIIIIQVMFVADLHT